MPHRIRFARFAAIALATLVLSACAAAAPTRAPTAVPTPTPTLTPAPTPFAYGVEIAWTGENKLGEWQRAVPRHWRTPEGARSRYRLAIASGEPAVLETCDYGAHKIRRTLRDVTVTVDDLVEDRPLVEPQVFKGQAPKECRTFETFSAAAPPIVDRTGNPPVEAFETWFDANVLPLMQGHLPRPVAAGAPVPPAAGPIGADNAAQIVELARWGEHSGPVTSVAVSQDGAHVASGAEDDQFHLWSTANGSLIVAENVQGVTGVAFAPVSPFTPEGGLVAVAGFDGLELWRVSDGRHQESLLRNASREAGRYASLQTVAFAPRGGVLVTVDNRNRLYVYQTLDWSLSRTVEGGSAILSFSPDGTTVATRGGRSVKLWQVRDGTQVGALEGHPSTVHSLAFSPDGALIASGTSSDDVVCLWQVADRTLLHVLEGHTATVKALAFAPDGTLLASGASDGTIRLWSVADRALLHTLEPSAGGVNSLAFSPDGRLLVSGTEDGTVRLWGVGD